MSAERTLPGIALPQEQEQEPGPGPDAALTGPPGTIPPEAPGPRGNVPARTGERPGGGPAGPGGNGGSRPGGPGAGPAGLAAELVPAPREPAGAAGLVLASLRGWLARAAAGQARHRGFWHWAWHGFWDAQPESLDQSWGYFRSRQWLEDYMTGWLRGFAEWENIAFGVLVTAPVKAACNQVSRVVERQSRVWAAAVFLLAVFIVWKAAHR